MTCFKVAVLDDEDVDSFLKKIGHDDFEFVKITPQGYDTDLQELKKEAFDAFIIDQKLSEHGHLQYVGTTIIQQLRTWMAENVIESAPIILWSSAGNITSYNNEHSSHNLVDSVWGKSEFPSINSSILASELHSLISGYKLLTHYIQSKSDHNIASIFIEDSSNSILIPEDCLLFLKTSKNKNEHTLAQFIINGLLRFDGPLINNATLASRLGVSISNSPAWNEFKQNVLHEIQYKGIFSQSCERFWSLYLEIWWTDNIDKRELIGLSAAERVAALNSIYHYDLQVAEASNGHTETYYWYSCLFSRVPLDPRDAFQLAFPQKRSWQDPIYISFDSIHQLKHKEDGFELMSDDLERFKAIRAANQYGR